VRYFPLPSPARVDRSPLFQPIPILYDKIWSKKELKKKWLETQVLIIDEVSMSPADLFTKLNVLGKMIRTNKKPFGSSAFSRFTSPLACPNRPYFR
jgi:hypothetical protein